MATITLITGGARSGKSQFAFERLLSHSGQKIYLATCPKIKKIDGEMDERILKHKVERKGKQIVTIEEEIDLKNILQTVPENSVVLIDCLTLWVNNLLFHKGHLSEEELINVMKQEFSLEKVNCSEIIVVTNEVGMGLVPSEKLGRHYRDLLGRANQFIGQLSREAYLVASGISLKLK